MLYELPDGQAYGMTMSGEPAPAPRPAGVDRPGGNGTGGGLPFVLEARSVSKRFGGVTALSSVDLGVRRGTVHALVGENGAGKSTLGRIFSGAVLPDAGDVIFEGRPVRFATPRDAQRAGVAAVSQELTLVPQLSVLDNVFLGVEERRLGVVARRATRRRFEELVEIMGLRLDPGQRVGDMSVPDRQKVEVLRALARGARLVVMDEPTAALAAEEVGQFLDLVQRLVRSGTTIIYVSHALDDVLEVADEVTVMRDGKVVGTEIAATETTEGLATAMLGRPLDVSFPVRAAPPVGREPICEVRDLARHPIFSDVNFSLRPGEIVGLAGLIDSGATAVARVLAGDLRPTAGEIIIDGQGVRFASPFAAIQRGVSLLPESRRDEGLFMRRPVRENVTATDAGQVSRLGFVQRALERRLVRQQLAGFDVRMASVDAPVNTLSGGNQQKVLFGKCVFMHPKLLVALQPTRGVDVGAKAAIYRLLVDLAAAGTGVLLVSPEIEEIYALAHRILVLRRGRVVLEVSPDQMSYEDLMAYVLGTAQDPAGSQSGALPPGAAV